MADNILHDDDELAELAHGVDPEDGLGEFEEMSSIEATETPAEVPMEFHVQMKGWQHRAFEEVIVQAAAEKMFRRLPTSFEKQIKDAALEMFGAATNVALKPIAAEILEQPIGSGTSTKPALTMREYIGLTGREYLTQSVDGDGKPCDGGYYSRGKPRIHWLISELLDRKFKSEIEKQTSTLISEIRGEMKKSADAMIAAEKARISEALAKATA